MLGDCAWEGMQCYASLTAYLTLDQAYDVTEFMPGKSSTTSLALMLEIDLNLQNILEEWGLS